MKRLTNEEVRVDESMDRYLGPLSVLEGMKPKLLDLILNGPVLNGVSKDVLRQIIRQLYSALAAYEDTRLEPEEIDMDHEAAEQLRHLCRNCDIDRLEELAEADRAGRLVVLPCKVGDTVWVTRNPWTGKLLKKPLDACVNGMKMYSHGLYVNLLFDTRKINGTRDYEINHIGKTVFLTHEEAEAALEAMKDV